MSLTMLLFVAILSVLILVLCYVRATMIRRIKKIVAMRDFINHTCASSQLRANYCLELRRLYRLVNRQPYRILGLEIPELKICK